MLYHWRVSQPAEMLRDRQRYQTLVALGLLVDLYVDEVTDRANETLNVRASLRIEDHSIKGFDDLVHSPSRRRCPRRSSRLRAERIAPVTPSSWHHPHDRGRTRFVQRVRQNDGKVEPLLIDADQFRAYVNRHAHLAAEGLGPVAEDTKT